MFRRADDRERIAHVEFTTEFQVKLEARDLKRRRRRAEVQIETLHGVVRNRGQSVSPGNA